MFLISVLRYALFCLVPLSLALTSYLYLYPVFHGCAFPAPASSNGPSTTRSGFTNTLLQHLPLSLVAPLVGSKDEEWRRKNIAPFRLLTLGDPQLEGDSSIDYVEAATLPRLHSFLSHISVSNLHSSPLQILRSSLHDLIDFLLDDLPKAAEVWRKRLDHVGNDYYLGHIYRTMRWWTKPSHITVLGDLVGSQWIDDDEFAARGRRFWERVFVGGEKVPKEYMRGVGEWEGERLIIGEEKEWDRRIVCVAGNHDVGYAGDLDRGRMERFERMFGHANYEMRFQLPISTPEKEPGPEIRGDKERQVPELRIVVLNDMNLDTPAGHPDLQAETYNFLNGIITSSLPVERAAHFTIVLTHIPLYKDAGICVDGPFFDFFEGGQFGNGVKEQNHLSLDASKGFLEGIFGMSGHTDVPGGGFGRKGVLFNGHDHEGCDVYHYINQSAPETEREWQATRYPAAFDTEMKDVPGLREVTVRSMMGDFGGNAGLLSLWFDEEVWEWRFEVGSCGAGTQHIWWGVHVLDLITMGVGIVYLGLWIYAAIFETMTKAVGHGNTRANGSAHKLSNGHANGIVKEVKVNGSASGYLSEVGDGKHSLRRKKSKIGLNESVTRSPVVQ